MEQDSRTRRQIGTFGLTEGTIQLGIGSSMMARISDNRFMFQHSSGWQTWEGGYQEIHPQDMGSTGPENEGGEPGPDALDEEGGEVVNTTIPEGGETGEPGILGDDDEGEIASLLRKKKRKLKCWGMMRRR